MVLAMIRALSLLMAVPVVRTPGMVRLTMVGTASMMRLAMVGAAGMMRLTMVGAAGMVRLTMTGAAGMMLAMAVVATLRILRTAIPTGTMVSMVARALGEHQGSRSHKGNEEEMLHTLN